jgi:hypothetical protein
MRTHAYTAVICIDERSFTALPLVEPPNRKLYEDPAVLFCGLPRMGKRSLVMMFMDLPWAKKSTYRSKCFMRK